MPEKLNLINPEDVTHDNMPYHVGMLVNKMEVLADRMDKHDAYHADRDKALEVLNFSACKLLPWLSRNKYVVGMIGFGVTAWFSLWDVAIRWFQWSFFPPRIGP